MPAPYSLPETATEMCRNTTKTDPPATLDEKQGDGGDAVWRREGQCDLRTHLHWSSASCATECGVAQEPPTAALPQAVPPQGITDALHAMSRLAGVIFAGQVVAVRRIDGGNDATGIVEIQFAVEDAVRGVSGGVYTLREWAGLWPAGEEPFRVGQRFLMLLHAPSVAGLSSPVGGMDGAIPIHGIGQTQASGSGRNGFCEDRRGQHWFGGDIRVARGPRDGPALGRNEGGSADVV